MPGAPAGGTVFFSLPASYLASYTRLLGLYRIRIYIVVRTTAQPTNFRVNAAIKTVSFATSPPTLSECSSVQLPLAQFDSPGTFAVFNEIFTYDVNNV